MWIIRGHQQTKTEINSASGQVDLAGMTCIEGGSADPVDAEDISVEVVEMA